MWGFHYWEGLKPGPGLNNTAVNNYKKHFSNEVFFFGAKGKGFVFKAVPAIRLYFFYTPKAGTVKKDIPTVRAIGKQREGMRRKEEVVRMEIPLATSMHVGFE